MNVPRKIIASREERADALKRIRKYLRVDEAITWNGSACWLWIGPTSGAGRGGGYGRISFQGMTHAVHILMYELFNGRRRHGMQVDHACNRRACCNPSHLEQVTHQVNQQRRDKRLKE